MKKRTSSLPILVLVAVVALVLGSFGTATAAGLSKAKVKAIATKVVNKKAATLTVANANNLGGVPASVYQDRVAHAHIATPVALAAVSGGTALATVSITVPSGVNFIAISGAASYFGGATIQSIWWDVDGTCAATGSATSGFESRAFTDTSNTSGVGSAALHAVLKVTPAAHSVKLCGRTNVATTVEAADLTVETVANGSTGGWTLRPTGAGANQVRPDGDR